MQFEHLKEHIRQEIEGAGVHLEHEFKLNDFVEDARAQFITYLKAEHNTAHNENIAELDAQLKGLDDIDAIRDAITAFFVDKADQRGEDRLRELVQKLRFKTSWEYQKPLKVLLYKNKVLLSVSVEKEKSARGEPSRFYIGSNYETERRLKDLFRLIGRTPDKMNELFKSPDGKTCFVGDDYFKAEKKLGDFTAKVYKNGTLELRAEPELIAEINETVRKYKPETWDVSEVV